MASILCVVRRRDRREVQRLIALDPASLEARSGEQLSTWDGYAVYPGSTPLIIASAMNDLRMLRCLLDQGANVNAADDDGRTSIYYASYKGNERVVSLLIERGADINQATDEKRLTPLMVAVGFEKIECMKRLIMPEGINVDARDSKGRTALLRSCVKNNAPVTQLLLEKGASPTLADNSGRSPLDAARHRRYEDCVGLLEAVERQRIHLLHKLRSIHDAEYAIIKAYDDAASDTTEQRTRKTMAAAPLYLKTRVKAGKELPVIEVILATGGEKKEEIEAAALEYVTSDGKLPNEVFVELTDMMML